jgi:REase_AHJR-like
MMPTSTASAAMRRVEQIAKEYRDQGYEVLVEPEAPQLPGPLAGFRPDLVARKGDEVVVIEVKSRASLDQPRLQELAEAVRGQPGWRFELVLLRPEPGPPGTKAWNAEDVAYNLQQVEKLLRSSHQEAALLLAWSAAEATLRLLANRERLALEREDAPYLLKLLATRAVITREQHDRLWDVMELRNAVAHGHKPPDLDAGKIEGLSDTISGLLEQSSRGRTRENEGAVPGHP